MILTITSGSTTVENAWGLVGNVVWSGDKQRAARTLTFDLATSQTDPNLPAVECPAGATVSFWDDNKAPIFQGQVVNRELADTEAMIPVVAHDRGRFLAGNDGTVKIRDETPEAAIARICRDYEIPVGQLATTGVVVRRKFVRTSLWNIFTSLYTLASRQTGQQYMARFEWDRLVVSVRSESSENLVIQPQSNLLTSRTVESIEDMRNSVGIYDIQTGMPLYFYYRYCFRGQKIGGLSRYMYEISRRRESGEPPEVVAEELGLKVQTVRSTYGRLKHDGVRVGHLPPPDNIGARLNPETYVELQRLVTGCAGA
ncbi:XkdQ/YqbQ family protein [Lawsonibacter sp. LCP25S3_G6]|uniref:XkdQ/YqbQ family protein n=1 Tax=unclassified Lawsonibacter TaxID=2617946 RepID=UPI003F98B685